MTMLIFVTSTLLIVVVDVPHDDYAYYNDHGKYDDYGYDGDDYGEGL